MKSSFRLSTALVTSLSLAMSHVPFAAFAQDATLECREGEEAEACLARTLEEAAAADGAAAEAEAAAQAEADAAAQAEADAAAQAEADAAAQAAADAAAAEAAQADADAAAAAAAEQAETEAAAAAAQAEADAAAAAAAAQTEAENAAAAEAAAQAEADAAAAAETAQAEAEAASAAAEAAAQAEADAAAQTEAETAAALDAAQAEAETAAAAAEAAAAEAAETADTAAEVIETPAEDVAETPEVAPADAEADALAEALAEAQAEEGDAETAEALPLAPTLDDISAEDAAELEAAAETAAAAEESVATPVDPVVQAEAEVAVEAAEAETQMQSLALAADAEPVTGTVTEVITEETARSADEEFSPIVSTETEATATAARNNGRNGNRNNGLTTLETALLAGAAGLVVGTIIGGNRQVVNRADDRVVVLRPDGDYQVIRDDDVLLRQPGNGVTTETFADGSSRSIVQQPDGTQVITVRDRDLRIIQRTVVAPNGTRTVLIDDTVPVQPVVISQLPQVRPVASAPITATDDAALRLALQQQGGFDRRFSLAQIRSIRAVRDLAPVVDLENLTFATGSAAIGPDQAQPLLALGRYMSDAIAQNPREMFLVEGHTDAVGSGAFNLALSDRRAESVALALTQYFGVPAQNMVIQGYGEDYLRVPTLADERANRRVAVRRVTELLQVASN